MVTCQHICGLYYIVPGRWERYYLPQVSLSVNAQIVASTSRTTLTQTFVSKSSESIPELRYTFPLYDGVSVVGFVCTVNDDRVIRGVVKERAQARKTFQDAVSRGETAGLLEQLPDASDVFTTTVGNVPAGATLKVEITYLGELKHDAEVDGIRFTIPTSIAPRYGSYPGQLQSDNVEAKGGISIVIDAEMPNGSNITSVQSPTHPIAVTVGNTSIGAAQGTEMSLQKASATLSLGTAELDKDFVLQVVATNTASPIAVLETHPSLPNHRALMATLVPKFNLPASRPEIVFVCDRSGSMWSGKRIPNLKIALRLFLKSLPLGVKFNICSFGSRYEFLFPNGSRSYDAASLEEANRYVDGFAADFGGTEMDRPMRETFKRRFKDMQLEVFMLTDGEIWHQDALFGMINQHVDESKGDIRLFTLGIGSGVSHALIEGIARAGNGFSQSVGDDENMNSKVIRMLKASLTPHIKDYTLEVKYAKEVPEDTSASDDDFEIVEKVLDGLSIGVDDEPEESVAEPPKPISLFDESVDLDTEMTDANLDTSAGGKYSHVPAVSEPKILQAPFAIPPLYPFSRTSVYLLLSADTTQKQPKSVVLRGTSPHGPLELEIPVTILKEKGETIHQLAARKAVKELEEGRGWIYHAKDAKDDKLLKDKYEGRFSDMVEREAVRLGVTYQVGGKWCSFVAVEANSESSHETASHPPSHAAPEERSHFTPHSMQQQQQQSQSISRGLFSSGGRSVGGGLFGSASSTTVDSAFGTQTGASAFGAQHGYPAPPTGGGLFGSASPALSQTGSSLFGSARPAAPQPMSGARRPAAANPQSGGLFGMAAPPPLTSMFASPSQGFQQAQQQVQQQAPFAHQQALQTQQQAMQQAQRKAAQLPPQQFQQQAQQSSQQQYELRASMASGQSDQMGQNIAAMSYSASFSHPPPPAPAPAAYVNTLLGLAPPTAEVDAALLKQYEAELTDAAVMPLPDTTENILEKLVALQEFEGQWRWTDGLFSIIFGTQSKDAIKTKISVSGLGSNDGLVATALVLVFLEEVCAAHKDEWEMLADKARDWMQGQIMSTGGSVDRFVNKVRSVFAAEIHTAKGAVWEDDDL
ncbi:von Willebrand factor type A domain-containing protein [Podospora australis]|uniref:von Willebrand factor type A domain-containing protein n=1 Tax=Podospora australis TaxID=1536484 RepID=A0AAN6WVU0_9PEZI|nr:von Willebrand factor type A domain-containing protein [Podospora australis]